MGKTDRGDIQDCYSTRFLDRTTRHWARGVTSYTVSRDQSRERNADEIGPARCSFLEL